MCGTKLVCDSVRCISALELVGHGVVFHHVGHYIIWVAVPAHHGLPVGLLSSHTRRHEINSLRHEFTLCVMIYIHCVMKYINRVMKTV